MQITNNHYERARQLYQINRKEQAVEELTKLLAAEPDNLEGLFLMVGCLIELKDNKKDTIQNFEVVKKLQDIRQMLVDIKEEM